MRTLTVFCFLLLSACTQSQNFELVGDSIPKPLSNLVGNPDNGNILFSTRSDAHCVLCHKHDTSDTDFQGNLGPDLTAVQNRLSIGQIRLRIVDYDLVKPETTMPSYYRTDDLHQLATEKIGKTVLTAQEIEDIIAFLTYEN